MVLEEKLALCAMAAARHRYKRRTKDGKTLGVLLLDEVSLLRGLVSLTSRETKREAPFRSHAAARRIHALYKAGYQDPEGLLAMIECFERRR